MIITQTKLISEKPTLELKVGDILKRKKDGFCYDLKNIQVTDGSIYLHFFGFVIVSWKNLKHHFEMDKQLNSFLIYGKD